MFAMSGGTGSPTLVSVGDPATTKMQFLAALDAIRGLVLSCDFPNPSGAAGHDHRLLHGQRELYAVDGRHARAPAVRQGLQQRHAGLALRRRDESDQGRAVRAELRRPPRTIATPSSTSSSAAAPSANRSPSSGGAGRKPIGIARERLLAGADHLQLEQAAHHPPDGCARG